MGHRELLLTLGAMVIFSMTTYTINKNILRQSDASYTQQAQFLAYTYAQRLIQEAKTKAFDENVIKGVATSASQFTYPPMHHPTMESYPNFDDVDDYNNLDHTFADSVIGNVDIHVDVDYVNLADLNTPVAYQTYYKRMRVAAINQYLSDSLITEYIFAYQKNK